MRRSTVAILCLLVSSVSYAQTAAPLLTPEETQALADTISGDVAMRNLEELVRHHRMRGSRGYTAAAEHIVSQLRDYGLSDAEILRFPADGKIYYGTQRSRRPWNVDRAELWEIGSGGERLVASWSTMPMRLAQDSVSGDATGSVIDVGTGLTDDVYEGKSIRGNLVLVSSQPEAIAARAIGRFGAAGILSYAQNQRTGWYGENDRLVRWGHLSTFAEHEGFAFMLSLQEARALQARLRAGEDVRMRASVRAGQEDGSYEIATATIPGSTLPEEEIVFSCHLDHPRPGANDNASGCSAILEVARGLSRLIADGKLPRPERTIRFVWPPEIEGTMALLAGRPGLAQRIKAAIHLDMVGGGPETKATFHVTRGPASLPSFIHDVSEEIGRWVNRETAAYAANGTASYPLVAASGSKDPLRAEMVSFTMGSDHQVYSDSSFGIPAIYMNDWPDRYIHTHMDVAANIDPTKLGRAAFIAAASGWVLANLSSADVPDLIAIHHRSALRRAADTEARAHGMDTDETTNLERFRDAYEHRVAASIADFAEVKDEQSRQQAAFREWLSRMPTDRRSLSIIDDAEPGARIYRRNPELKGPMSVFGYDYFADRFGSDRANALALNRAGSVYAYELLNFVDGRRTAESIRNALSASYGPVPREAVLEYLEALQSVGVIELVQQRN